MPAAENPVVINSLLNVGAGALLSAALYLFVVTKFFVFSSNVVTRSFAISLFTVGMFSLVWFGGFGEFLMSLIYVDAAQATPEEQNHSLRMRTFHMQALVILLGICFLLVVGYHYVPAGFKAYVTSPVQKAALASVFATIVVILLMQSRLVVFFMPELREL